MSFLSLLVKSIMWISTEILKQVPVKDTLSFNTMTLKEQKRLFRP